jgi:Mg-chelatase subunit ChlI
MNPEEGDLRPQFLDRFAHCVMIRDDFSSAQRVEIIKRRLAFDFDPAGFVRECATETQELRRRIAGAGA